MLLYCYTFTIDLLVDWSCGEYSVSCDNGGRRCDEK